MNVSSMISLSRCLMSVIGFFSFFGELFFIFILWIWLVFKNGFKENYKFCSWFECFTFWYSESIDFLVDSLVFFDFFCSDEHIILCYYWINNFSDFSERYCMQVDLLVSYRGNNLLQIERYHERLKNRKIVFTFLCGVMRAQILMLWGHWRVLGRSCDSIGT